jgi:hypothetical protein
MRSSPEHGSRTTPGDATRRPRARVIGAFLEGWRRVIHAPAVTAGIWLMTLVVALPLAALVGRAVEAQLGSSLDAATLTSGWNARWEGEFAAGATGPARTFTHEILGFGGTLATASRFADAVRPDPSLVGAIVLYVAIWVFLSGGILDRLARGRPVRASAFFAACGVYAFRFARLAIVVGAAYWALFRWIHPFLFDRAYDRLTRDLATEHQVIIVRAGLYVVFFAALALVSLVADFAKVRAVVEDRHSMLSAIGAAVRFLRRRPLRSAGLYLLNVLALFVIARLWLQIAPAAGAPDWSALLAAQVFLLARVWAKLAFMASEVVFFQGELAHATYTALPTPVWPDSASVEAIRNLRRPAADE